MTDPLLPQDFDAEEAETANIDSIEQGVNLEERETLSDKPVALSKTRRRFQQGVRKALLAKELLQKKSSSDKQSRRNSLARDMLQSITDETPTTNNEPSEQNRQVLHRIYDKADYFDPLFDDTESGDSDADLDESQLANGLLRSGTQYGTSPGSSESNTQSRGRRVTASRVRRLRSFLTRRFWKQVGAAILRSTLLWVALPCAIAALVLYYPFANPMVDFLPGSVTLAWWFNFIAKQMVTLELARLLEFIVVDTILLKTRWDSRQLVSFVAYHIEGWPFILAAWGTIDLFFLHGDNRFQVHWLWWTRWRIYSREASSGAYLLTSSLYLRALLSMIFLGAATVIKRCVLELQFGGRLHSTFKPKLEQILREIVLVTEISALSEEAEFVQDLDDIDADSVREKASKVIGLASQSVDWSMTHSTVPGSPQIELPGNSAGLQLRFAASRVNGNQSISGLEALLDRWDEPSDNDKQTTVIGVNDAVTFRRVLAHLKKKTPFGESFGPSWNRHVTILSSQKLYNRLLKLSESATLSLPFETLSVVAVGSDGEIDKDKLRALRKVFCPDAKGELPLLAFVGSIDAVYKRLRYFQASVANASKIDKVLEDTFNVIFFFVLGLVILVFMEFNPWPILVSITSLLVSVSFALGTSLSKWVEGILLIAVRRPYDLGDRIIITGAESLENPGSTASWFVEDINLFSTTLRYARTNEVCSVNNSSIASSRIINCNRSSNAIVFLDKVTHISILDGDNLRQFRLSLENYVHDNPRIWDSLAYLRIENIDPNFEQVKFSMAFRHRNSWQDAARILLNRADLLRFVFDTLKGLDAAYDTPPMRQLLYYGGELEEGQVKDYKVNLLNPANIRRKPLKVEPPIVDLFDNLQKPLEGE